jgi:hypothetical protein
MWEHILILMGFALSVIGAGALGLIVTVYAINYWEGFF